MRHYDRADFRRSNDRERNRDEDSATSDALAGARAQVRREQKQQQAEGRAPAVSFEGRGPRREPMGEPRSPALHRVLDALFHPKEVLLRVALGLFRRRSSKHARHVEQRILEDVCERLARHRDVDASDVKVTVRHGEVSLTGTVGDRKMKTVAEDAIEGVQGVKDIHNRLTIRRSPGASSRPER